MDGHFKFDEFLADKLLARKRANLYRQRKIIERHEGIYAYVKGKRYLNFSSNDYLGLANHPGVIQACQQGLQDYGVGSGASHLITGHTEAHHRLEEQLADWLERDRALIFSTGYMANLGILGALVARGDRIIEDRLNHASLIDAAHSTLAKTYRYPHADMDSLSSLLTSATSGRVFVVTDGVFSMDGDLANLAKITDLCQRHQATLIVDDAHGCGVLGDQGRGVVEYFRLNQRQLPVLMGTFGKGFGVFGAFVAGSNELIETLIQKSRTYIYTTALPPALAVATIKALELVNNEQWRRDKLYTNICYLREQAKILGLNIAASITAIQPLIVGDSALVVKLSERLFEEHIMVMPIRPPTVPEGTARLRITLSALHEFAHIDMLLAALTAALSRVL